MRTVCQVVLSGSHPSLTFHAFAWNFSSMQRLGVAMVLAMAITILVTMALGILIGIAVAVAIAVPIVIALAI